MLTQANAGKHVYIAHSHWRGHGWRRRRWRDARVRQRLFLTHCLRRRDCGRRRRRTRYVCESVFFLLHDFVLCIFMLGARCNNKYSEFGLEFSEMFVRFSELIWVECCCFFFFLFSFYFFFCILWAHFSFSSFILPLRRFFCSAHFIFIFFFFVVLLCAHYLYILIELSECETVKYVSVWIANPTHSNLHTYTNARPTNIHWIYWPEHSTVHIVLKCLDLGCR